jgi:FAD/FMN-containing dehydrogenase
VSIGEAGRTDAATGSALEVHSWDHTNVTRPRALVAARSVDDVVAVLRDPERYPSPVRPRGSGHSPANCGEAEGGTIVDMRPLDRILEVDEDRVRVEAGALYIDVAKELERRGLQLHINTEIGCLTVGSAACCATKDASMPGELGQISSYVLGMKIVTASGELLEITESDPELLQAARSSYGLFGIVVEVTFAVRPIQRLAVEHRTYGEREFLERLPELIAHETSLMFYLYPFIDKVTVEFRRYVGEARVPGAGRPNRWVWALRNFTWRLIAPGVAYWTEQLVPSRRTRNAIVNEFNRLLHVLVDRLIASANTAPPDQIIRYPAKAGVTAFTSSIWAFPEESFASTLDDFFSFMRRYDREHGWRPDMLAVGYRVLQDREGLLSYSWDGPVLTIDPVSTWKPGWTEFLDAWNAFASEHGGSPLLNQSRGVTPEQARKAFGERLSLLEERRRRLDPDGRLLNGFFRALLPVESGP